MAIIPLFTGKESQSFQGGNMQKTDTMKEIKEPFLNWLRAIYGLSFMAGKLIS
jgi:hypothetical protein